MRRSSSAAAADVLRVGLFAILKVEDDGVGCPKDLLAGDQDSLVLVTSLARQLGGKVSYSGNGGVRFAVTFPLE